MGSGEQPRFGVSGSVPLLLSSHGIVAPEKLLVEHSPLPARGAALPAPALGWGSRSSRGQGGPAEVSGHKDTIVGTKGHSVWQLW